MLICKCLYTCVIPQYIYREKFLNFIASYDVIDLPSSKLYSVIKKNLATSQALIYVRQVSRTHTRALSTCRTRVVFQFNATTAEEELRLGCGDRDLAQWREREPGIAGVSFSQMVRTCSQVQGVQQF